MEYCALNMAHWGSVCLAVNVRLGEQKPVHTTRPQESSHDSQQCPQYISGEVSQKGKQPRAISDPELKP